MTAAAARPPLFDHLVASRPERDRNSFSAPAASVVLHGAIVAAVLMLGARVRAPESAPEPVVLLPDVVIAGPTQASRNPPTGQGGVVRPDGPVAPPTLPDIILSTIPKPGETAVEPFPDRTPTLPGRPEPGPTAGPVGTRIGDPSGGFVAVTVLPKLLNRDDVQRTMTRLYPALLLQAGIGGTTIVWLRLDEEGRVTDTQIKQGSGQRALDEAALEVGKRARFSPAYNGDARVRIWIELPVVFSVGR